MLSQPFISLPPLLEASFEHLEEGRYELVLGCELGACSAEALLRGCGNDRSLV